MAELFKVNAPVRKPLFEGVQGENEARSIQFDIEPWVTELGDGAVTATAKRSQDSQPYPVTVTKDGNIVTWKPTSTDTAYAGVGSFQLEYTVDSVLAKTCIWSTMVAPSLDPAGDPPDPYDNWLAEMREIAADAIQAAQDADASADDAQAEVYEAEAWAKGTKNGTPVPSTADQYHDNAKYYSEESYKNAEAWAVGQRGGVDVPSTDPAYENNSKYWAEQSLANQYGAYIVKSASGDIASFSDGADDVPMKSVKVAIVPKQSGSGDPSPSNVRPITGTSTANVSVTGKNMFDSSRFLDATNWTESGGVYTGDSDRIASNKGAGLPYLFKFSNPTTGQYSISLDATSDKTYRTGYVIFNYSDGTQSVAAEIVGNTWTHYSGTSTAGKTVTEVAFLGSNSTMLSIKNFQLEVGSTATSYEPYTGHTTPVPLGQTVYGGEVDVTTGVLTVTKAYADMGALTWNYYNSRFDSSSLRSTAKRKAWGVANPMAICSNYTYGAVNIGSADKIFGFNDGYLYVNDSSYTSAGSFKTAMNGVQLVYELATPTTVQLTPAQVATLLGTNNVWSDAGSVEVEYRADPTLAYNELANVIVSLGGNL